MVESISSPLNIPRMFVVPPYTKEDILLTEMLY